MRHGMFSSWCNSGNHHGVSQTIGHLGGAIQVAHYIVIVISFLGGRLTAYSMAFAMAFIVGRAMEGAAQSFIHEMLHDIRYGTRNGLL